MEEMWRLSARRRPVTCWRPCCSASTSERPGRPMSSAVPAAPSRPSAGLSASEAGPAAAPRLRPSSAEQRASRACGRSHSATRGSPACFWTSWWSQSGCRRKTRRTLARPRGHEVDCGRAKDRAIGWMSGRWVTQAGRREARVGGASDADGR
ncbi:unnamed protein product [Phaeothamnion confervicola]